MKSIKCMSDLREYGVAYLTGEADALSFRGLCDLTERGAGIVAETYGLKRDGFAENWNPGSEGEPHVGSCMLPHGAWKDIGIIALAQRPCHTVLAIEDGPLYGLTGEEEYVPAVWTGGFGEGELTIAEPAKIKMGRQDELMDWPDCYGKVARVFAFGDHPRRGSRNVHAMSGRAG